LSLVRGHTVSLFFQKIKQEGSVLWAILERGAAEQEAIYILEEFTRGEMEGKEVPSPSLAKEGNCPGTPEARQSKSIVEKYEYLGQSR
jgi:hypothetical protein